MSTVILIITDNEKIDFNKIICLKNKIISYIGKRFENIHVEIPEGAGMICIDTGLTYQEKQKIVKLSNDVGIIFLETEELPKLAKEIVTITI